MKNLYLSDKYNLVNESGQIIYSSLSWSDIESFIDDEKKYKLIFKPKDLYFDMYENDGSPFVVFFIKYSVSNYFKLENENIVNIPSYLEHTKNAIYLINIKNLQIVQNNLIEMGAERINLLLEG
jgi:hypothetical protein